MSKNKPSLQVFGIRHHGPGSARRLLQALERWQPDCLLVEFPADAQKELEQMGHLALEPPIALVVYDQNNIQQAYYYPFARFSPEWQALRWAARAGVASEAIDLPVGTQLALKEQKQLEVGEKVADPWQRDPLGEVARLAGFTDREQWWDLTFEQETDDFALFSAINELIATLRSEAHQNSRETLLREAFMRKALRKAMRAGYERVAIVCGAWHSPALLDVARYKVAADTQVLRGLPKVKVKAAWIPWSYPRLSRENGYGAGVKSPAWYELLYDYNREATIHWMVKAAQLLRKEGLDTSPAHAQEAVHLAYTLAGMRGQRIPNLGDLHSAALSILCHGSEERLQLIEKVLMLGEKVGQVPENASVVPLQKDLTQRLKTTRLTKYWGITGEKWLKGTKTNPRGGIDLREDNDLQKSQLLHSLQILDISWGHQQEVSANDLGAFKELWLLQWQPEFSLSILEAAMWGNSLPEAADNKLRQQDPTANILQLSQAVLLGLKADLRPAVDVVTQLLRDRSALTKDVQELLAGLPTLIKIIQYGDARKTDVTALAILVEEIAPRLAAALPASAMNIDEEAAQLLLSDFLATHRGLCQLALPLLDDHWWPAVEKLANIPGIAPLLKGLATRLLFDQERLDLEETSQRLDFALSPGNEPMEVTNWLAGFLNGSGLLLLHHPPLWQLVDRWVQALPLDELEPLLPLLRRTFAQFSPGERQRMLGLVQKGYQPEDEQKVRQESPPVVASPLAEDLLVAIRGWIME
ncbi:MAG: DUF5682 family protein [Lewinella sp.]|uniref:DUF5682 family protein n=1 Tax=Lewinella sp. TaxID=2004506 RepID=UPI003D6BC5C5